MRAHLTQTIRSFRSTAISALAGLVVLGLAACGDDATGPDISQEQAEEVAAAVSNGVAQGFFIALGQGGGAASRAPDAFTPRGEEMPTTMADGSYTFDDTRSCPSGGTVDISGDGTVNTINSTTEWEWNSQASYSSCGVETDQGTVFVLNTSSPLQYSGNGSVTSGQTNREDATGSFTWNYSGTVDWDEQGGPSASCEVDLTATLDISASGGTVTMDATVNGTTCRRDIDRSFSETETI